MCFISDSNSNGCSTYTRTSFDVSKKITDRDYLNNVDPKKCLRGGYV